MNLLTPTGYKNINDVNIGDEVIAYDINTGQQILNILLGKDLWTHNMLPENPEIYKIDEEGNILLDEEGNQIIETPLKTSEEVFDKTYGDWKFYLINGTWKLYVNQSIWANMKVIHVKDLQIGDIIYDDNDQDIIITSIEEVSGNEWWRLTISGDHSFISEGLTLHNASRYWSGNATPTSFNWNYNTGGVTNWGSASGTADNATIPTSADDVTFDGAGTKGNANSTISATITILSLNITAGYTATMTHNAVLTIAGNLTLNTGYTIAGTSAITISAASTITSNGKTWPNGMTINSNFIVTLNGNFVITGRLTFNNSAGVTTTLNATTNETITVGSINFIFVDTVNGTGYIILKGIILSSYSTVTVQSLAIDGTVTFPASFTLNIRKELKYLSGTVGTVNIGAYSGATFDTNPLVWNNIAFNGSTPFNINSLLTANSITIPGDGSGTCNLQGTSGFVTNSIILARNLILKELLTYTINTSFRAIFQGGFTELPTQWEVKSNHASLKANVILTNGATCNNMFKFTRIDASGGRTINTFNGTVTDCVNVRSFTDLQTVASSTVI